MPSSIQTLLVAGLAALAALPRAQQDSPELMRVGSERVALRALAQEEGSPVLGELLPGTAVRVTERRDGFARVLIEGWIAEPALAGIPSEEIPVERPAPPPAPRPPPTPVRDLTFAHHVGVAVQVRGPDDARELEITLEMRSIRNEPVIVEGTRHVGRVRVFEQRRVAGGRARGPELLAREVAYEAGRATLVVPLKDFDGKAPAVALVSASAEIDAQRTVHGAATDVAVAAPRKEP